MENTNGLIAPPDFWELSKSEIDSLYFGCGPGKVGDWLVPDHFFGIDVKLACQIHDFDYDFGVTEEDRIEADCRFLHNLYILIEEKNYPIFEPFCYHRAHLYYEAVRVFGEKAFYAYKDNNLTTC